MEKGLQLIKNRLQHRCFLVKIASFLRRPILKNICEWLLLLLVMTDSKWLENPWRNDFLTCSKLFGQKRLGHKTQSTPSLCQSFGSKSRFSNYWGISLFSIAGKVLTTIVRSDIAGINEAKLWEAKANFCQEWRFLNQILCLIKCLKVILDRDSVSANFLLILQLIYIRNTKTPSGLPCRPLIWAWQLSGSIYIPNQNQQQNQQIDNQNPALLCCFFKIFDGGSWFYLSTSVSGKDLLELHLFQQYGFF